MIKTDYALAAFMLQGVIMIFLWVGLGTFDVSPLGKGIIALIEAAACVLVLHCAFRAGEYK